MKGERIKQARELAGLTQAELAERAAVAQSAIAQIEAGIYEPSQSVLEAISEHTGFDSAFLSRETAPADFPLSSLLYRSQSKVSAKDKAKAHRLAQLMFELAVRMRLRLRDIPAMLPRLSEDPISCAGLTRSSLGLSPDTPLQNLTATLERAGVLILRLPLEIEGLDGFSAWVGPTQNIPVICLMKPKPGYRDRLTLSEETAHLVMHNPLRISVEQAENEAKAFAGEFMFPEEAMRLELTPPITLASLAQSKHRWGASINFQVVQASRIGLITQNQYRYLMQQLSAKGWRKQEQGDENIPAEKPRVFLKMAEVVYGSPIDLKAVKKETGIPMSLLRTVFAGAAQRGCDTGGIQLVKREDRLLA